MNTELLLRNNREAQRSAIQARSVQIAPIDRERYVNPPANTAYALEYAYHLLGEVRGKTVLDLGCGSGETVVPLVHRGASVIGIDISEELIAIARQRMKSEAVIADLRVGSAYQTELPDASVDVVFCMSLIHHLDIRVAMQEMRRILLPGGIVVLKEPIRFSTSYASIRALLPAHNHISEDEHPLTESELRIAQQGFCVEGLRYFRLPLVPLLQRTLRLGTPKTYGLSAWVLDKFPATSRFATVAVMRLRKQ